MSRPRASVPNGCSAHGASSDVSAMVVESEAVGEPSQGLAHDRGQCNHNDDDDPTDTDNGELVLTKTLKASPHSVRDLAGADAALVAVACS